MQSRFPAFHLKCPAFFLRISSWKKCALCALLSVKWNSDDSATSFLCSAKLIRSAMSATISLQLTHRDITDSETVYFVIQEHHLIGSCIFFVKLCVFCLLFYKVRSLMVRKNTNSRFLRFFVRSVPLFRSLRLTPMRRMSQIPSKCCFVLGHHHDVTTFPICERHLCCVRNV